MLDKTYTTTRSFLLFKTKAMFPKLNLLGAIITHNTELGYDEVQRIDDAMGFARETGITVNKQLRSDLEAKEIAISLGFKFDDVERPLMPTHIPPIN